jgi:hypothetical protein
LVPKTTFIDDNHFNWVQNSLVVFTDTFSKFVASHLFKHFQSLTTVLHLKFLLQLYFLPNFL